MTNRRPDLHKTLAAALTIFALVLVDDAFAGMLSMAVDDFVFKNGAIDYSPTLDRVTLESSDLSGARQTTLGAGTPAIGLAEEPTTELKLRADTAGSDLLQGRFNIFGSLNSAAEASVPALIEESFDAMQTRRVSDDFGFLFVGGSHPGDVALRLLKVGLYTHVSGSPPEESLRVFEASRLDVNLSSVDKMFASERRVMDDPIPVPATPLLLMLGMLSLLGLHRRQKSP